MKITVHGAGGGEVTGSAYLVQTREANVLVDCGLFQGANKLENYNRIPKRGAFARLDAVVLTHAHLDHTGRLPLLTRAGYNGPIHATPATIDFADLILKDSAHLQKSDVERVNRRRERSKILVPVFAVGRTQLLLYLLAGAFQRGTLSPFPIYIDSPMAIEATKLYRKHVELFDDEALAMQKSGELRDKLDTVKFCPTAQDSRALNDVTGACMIMAGAGNVHGRPHPASFPSASASICPSSRRSTRSSSRRSSTRLSSRGCTSSC
jgi:Cft2 family RNA processing exonuclease